MLTNPQKALLKRAQRQAGVADEDYRETLAHVSGFTDLTSSTDPRLTDDHFDRLLAFFETIYRRGVDAGTLPLPRRGDVLAVRGYWAAKNKRGQTSRDRYADTALQARIRAAETALKYAGKGPAYCDAIRRKTGDGWPYLGALQRTLKAMRKTPKQP